MQILLGARTLLIVIAAGVAAGCAFTAGDRSSEPSVIIVRNNSGFHVQEIMILEANGAGHKPVRFGSIAPLPAGVSQVIGRPSSPQRLPRSVDIVWIDAQAERNIRRIALKQVLRNATGGPGEAIVFQIGPLGDVTVSLETH